MNRLIRDFLQGLHDRIIASVGSTIGSTFSTFRAAHHAEQQSLLEDLARNYESEGKTRLAEQVRNQAAALNADDPSVEARIVFQNVLDDRAELPALGDRRPLEQSSSESDPPKSAAKKKRRSRKDSPPIDDMGISLD